MKSLLTEVARGAGERRRAKRAARVAGVSVVVLALAGVKLLMHLATTGAFGYGFFVDELYFLACAQHLDWGFVDMPPLFPLITAAARALLGDSLLAVRVVPMLAGAGLVLLTGLITRDLGGGRVAQGLAGLAVLAAPIYMLAHGVHTMNALDPLFWMGCAWALIRRIRDDQPRWWLVFGALAGLGSLNKHSMLFFGVAVAAGVVLTRLRRDLSERWIWLGALLALAVFLPNLIWLIAHGFPHLEHLASIRADGRDVAMNPALFMAQQALMLNPVSLPLWLGGLAWLLFDARGAVHRALGLAYLALLAEMFLMDGRVYYTAPFYPLLFAAGGVALQAWTARRPGGARRWHAALVGLLVVSGLVLAPAALPCLPPELFVRYAEATGINQPRVENHRLGPLPQLFADRFGWPEMTEV
ncbi:MAG TPA: glycosyltransferase family 39 protein, partial [Candidatus Polarisedimenticolia bacterium]|nr:glycosyltransferase family 39 protein [Candidatus Polarisedimenticolia bacterium]